MEDIILLIIAGQKKAVLFGFPDQLLSAPIQNPLSVIAARRHVHGCPENNRDAPLHIFLRKHFHIKTGQIDRLPAKIRIPLSGSFDGIHDGSGVASVGAIVVGMRISDEILVRIRSV